jgi:hypothetical protein
LIDAKEKHAQACFFYVSVTFGRQPAMNNNQAGDMPVCNKVASASAAKGWLK